MMKVMAQPAAPERGSSIDDVIDLYKKDVDRGLLREALKLTPAQRLVRLQSMIRFVGELRRAGREAFR